MNISIIFCLVVAILLIICVFVLIYLIRKMQETQIQMTERIDQLIQMNAKLRANRHDYLNSLQIVYGMVELEEYEELHKYLEPMYQDIMKTGKALKTSIPAVNALLMAKMSEAEARGINFSIEVKSALRDMEISDWELCRVLANLMDNAIRAVADNDDKKVSVDINETKEHFFFRVYDNGEKIPREMEGEIFKEGFTTKKEEGHGMGLSIVSKLLNKNKGSVRLVQEEQEKFFEVVLPKKEERRISRKVTM